MSGRHSVPEPSDIVEMALTPAPGPRSAPPSPALPPPATVAPTAVAAEHAGYERGGRVILDDVSVRCGPGEVLGLVGPSGSGKSSLIALLAGLEQPDSGTIVAASGRVGLILQAYGLAGVLTAAENVEMPLQAGALGRLDPDEIRVRANAALDLVGLGDVATHLIEELSGGQQQRVAIARALVIEPSTLLADELTAELDHHWRERITDLVYGVARRGGVVVIATHDLEIAAGCDRVVRLQYGRVE